jgi:ADP-ribosyl-[dinitrogen reductase] hydrolase
MTISASETASSLLVVTLMPFSANADGALAGGLAGIYYGYEGIPKEWVQKIAKVDEIIKLGERLYEAIYGIS